MEREPLDPQIKEAQKELKSALDEACSSDVEEVDTGELIRIEESLAVASKAAKQAVSLRLKRRNERAQGTGSAADRASEGDSPDTSESEDSGKQGVGLAHIEATHRVFDDYRGKRWHAFAVHPSAATAERSSLPESYRHGWLSFEASDEMRRVAPIPDRWESLSIDDLRHLCAGAAPTPKRINALEGSTNLGANESSRR